MKKILTVLLTSLLMLCAPFTMTFADTKEDEQVVSYEDVTVKLEANQPNVWYAKLPTTVDVVDNEIEFKIYFKGDVAGNKEMTVAIGEGKHYLKDSYGKQEDVEITTTVDKNGKIAGMDITGDYSETNVITVTINHDDLSAGLYKCDLPVKLACADIVSE